MADQIVSGDSKDAVAYALLLGIAQNEGKIYTFSGVPVVSAPEQWVFDTYAKCIKVVHGEKP